MDLAGYGFSSELRVMGRVQAGNPLARSPETRRVDEKYQNLACLPDINRIITNIAAFVKDNAYIINMHYFQSNNITCIDAILTDMTQQ
eukprot:scaffold241552_cov26-Prasinocladus_malaysianus.AAC.1